MNIPSSMHIDVDSDGPGNGRGKGVNAAHSIVSVLNDGDGFALVTTVGPMALVEQPIFGKNIVLTGAGVYTGNQVSLGPIAEPAEEGYPTQFYLQTPYSKDAFGGSWKFA